LHPSQILHENTLKVANTYKHAEKRLIDLLIQNDEIKAFRSLGYSSLHVYCTSALGLSDAVAYSLTQIARKSKEIPEIKELVQAEKLTISNAMQLSRVITPKNKVELLDLGQNLSKRELEKEIKRIFPLSITAERITAVNEVYNQVKIHMNDSTEKDLDFLQHYYSKKLNKKNLSLSETVTEMARELRYKYDPIKIAQRRINTKAESAKTEKEKPLFVPGAKSMRIPIPAQLRHQINLRDKAKCTFHYSNGSRCTETRWLNFHHITPVSMGGATSLENLTTICFNHHAYVHELAKRPVSEHPARYHKF